MIAVTELAVPAYIVERREAGDYVVVEVNRAAAELWTGQVGASLGPMPLSEAFPEEVARRVAESYDLCLRTGRPLERDSSVPSPRGEITARTTIYPLMGDGIRRSRMLCIVTDVTEERRIRDDLEQSNARLAVAMDALGGAHWFYDAVRRIFELGPSFSRILGARYQPTMSMSDWLEIVHPDDRDDPSFLDLLDGTERQWVGEFRIIDAVGDVRWLRCFRRAVAHGFRVSGIAGVVVDVTAEKQRESALLEQALTDPLTGLINRRGFDRFLTASTKATDALSLMMIDVDQFKSYNDTYGHVAGDAVLRRVSAAIDGVVSPLGGVVARFGGEEFVVIVPHLEGAEAKRVAERLLRAVSDMALPHAASERGVITVSAGYAARAAQDPPIDLVAAADAALYRAKREGRNCCRPMPISRPGENNGAHVTAYVTAA